MNAESTVASVARVFGRAVRRVWLPLVVGLLGALAPMTVAGEAGASVRIKDIVDIEGVRDNMLVGYGLVIGVKGTGDTFRNSAFTQQSLTGMLERMGVNVRGVRLDPKNVAAVMVTATLPAYAAQGTRIDVAVGALGDAASLQGGTLLVTPLVGADGEVYAVAQGPVSVAGFSAQGASGSSITQGVPTSGRIAAGAIVEREIEFSLAELPVIRVSLRNPDFTTARRVAEAINGRLGPGVAQATDPSSVMLTVPQNRRGDIVGLMTDIEQVRVEPDQHARVVIDDKTGVIVMGENVRISTVAVAQGNLTVRVTETPQVSQPNAFSQTGTTQTAPRSDVQVDTQSDRRLAVMPAGVSLQELVQNLNALGVGPRDMVSILQSIKAAGALQAEIDVM